MTPSQTIAALDRQIAKHGETVKFKRGVGALTSLRAFVRGFKPAELVGLLKQGDRTMIMSPTGLGAFGVPAAQDKVVFLSGTGTVQSVEPVHMDGVLVRINLMVRGD